MKRTTEILIAALLFLAGVAFADIKPVGFKCEILSNENTDEAECHIAQFDTESEGVALGYNVFTNWSSFKDVFVDDVKQFASLANNYVNVIFDTDFDLGGYSETDKKCNNDDFAPIEFELTSFREIIIEGDYKTVSGFCYIAEDKNASFFASLNGTTVRNLNFDNAYVMSKMVSAKSVFSAAVVVDEAENTSFENVTVSDSKVHGWNSAAVAFSTNGESKFQDVRIDNVFLSLSEESAGPQASSFYNNVSYSGGVVAYLLGQAEITNVSVTNLVVPDSIAQILERNGTDYTGAYNVGGIVGFASVTMDGPTKYSLEGCTVSAELSGSTVGGLIGSVSPYTITKESLFEVTNANVTFKSGDYSGTNQNRYVGGLVGSLAWKHGSVQLSKNTVETTIKITKTDVGSYGSRLGGVVGVYTGLNNGDDSPASFAIDENEVTVDISTPDKSLAVGGIVGYATTTPANSTFAIRNTTVRPIDPENNPNLITASASNMNTVHAAYGVGHVSNSNGEIEILGNHAEGNISIAASSVARGSAVGGMAGMAQGMTMNVHNNTSVGDLDVAITNSTAGATSDFFSVGYEVGEIRAGGNTAKVDVSGNYHYGSSDVNAALAVGWVGLEGADKDDMISPDIWKTQAVDYYRIWNNYRNAVSDGSVSLDAEGVLDVGGSGAIYVKNEKKWLYDGVIDSAAMKSRLFTYVLNGVSAGTKACSESDAVCWENELDSLPKISERRTAYMVSIDLDEIYDELTDADKDSLKDCMIETNSGSHSIVTYTETYGMPNYDFIRRVEDLGVIYGLFEDNGVASSVATEVDPYNLYLTSDYHLKAKEVPYEKVYLDVNTDADEVFFGIGSDVSDSLVVPNSVKYISLPSQIYTATACVAGWSFVKDTTDFAYHMSYAAQDIYNDMNAEKTLYAVWWDADQCAGGHYNKVVLNSENGTIAIDEYRDGAKVYSHHFAKDSTVLLPMGMLGSAAMLVHAEPDSGYKFDSLVVEILDTVFFEGDTLPEYLRDAVLKAYFSEKTEEEGNQEGNEPGKDDPQKNPQQDTTILSLVRHEFAQSGNAIRLILETNKFDVHRSAKLKVALMDAQGVVLDEPLLAKSIKETPYNSVWTKYPLKPGKYAVKAMLYDGQDTAAFDTSFVVNAEIAVKPDTWKMVSLSDVETESIDDDDDQLLYWWDESALYGEFWKYQKYLGEESNPERGYWYSSLEGRALMLQGGSPKSGEEIVWALDSGWNMVANPYGWFVNLSELETEDLNIWSWDEQSAGYKDTTLLAPYEAVWVSSDSKKEVRFDAAPEFEKQGETFLKRRVLAKAQSNENWSLRLTLSDAKGHKDSWNVLGVGEAEERLEPPMGMGDLVRLTVISGKRMLAKSVLPVGNTKEYSWEVALSASSDRVGYLNFEGVKALNGMGLRVFVTVDEKTAEIVAGDPLKVMLKAAGSTATVRVSSADIRTVASKLENLRFERVSGALQVGFDVTEGLAGSPYKVQLVGLNGQVAATYSGKSVKGLNTLALTAPKPGLYLLRVTVAGHHLARKVSISR